MKKSPHEKVVCGVFETREEAHRALDRLASQEVPPEDISLITNLEEYEAEECSEMAGEKIHDESLRAAKWGGLIGAVLAGWTATFGMWMGGAQALAAMPLIAVITALGGLLGAVLGAGFQENQADAMNEALREGKILLAVHSDDGGEVRRAEGVLRECHAHAVHHY